MEISQWSPGSPDPSGRSRPAPSSSTRRCGCFCGGGSTGRRWTRSPRRPGTRPGRCTRTSRARTTCSWPCWTPRPIGAFPLHSVLMLDASSIEEGLRASAREMAQYAREHPGWTGVYVEFWTHASRRPQLRAKVAEQHERLLGTVSGLVAEWASRWGVEFTLPAREVVRGVYAISRGLGLEALLADDTGTLDPFEEMFLAYVMGLIRARPATGAPGWGGSRDQLPPPRPRPSSTPADRPCAHWPASSWPGTAGHATGCSSSGRAAAGACRPRRCRLALLPGGAGAGRGLGRRAASGAADAAQDDDDGQLRPGRHRPPASPGGPGGAPVRARRRPAIPGAIQAVHYRRHHRGSRAVRGGSRRVRCLDRDLPAGPGQLGPGAGDPAGRDRLPQPAAHHQPGLRGAAGQPGPPRPSAGRRPPRCPRWWPP